MSEKIPYLRWLVVLSLGRIEIALLLLGLSVLGFVFWVLPFEALLTALGVAEQWYGPSAFSEFILNAMLSLPSIALAVSGLILYFRGRRMFWKTGNSRYSVEWVLVSVGLLLVVVGVLFTLQTYSVSVYYAGKPNRPGKTLEEYLFFRNLPFFVWFGLLTIAGIVLLADFLAHERTHR